MIIGFWIIFGLVLFAAALSMQMRGMIATVLGRCLAEEQPQYPFPEARKLIRYVRHTGDMPENLVEIRTLFETGYAQAWRHMHIARRTSVLLMPVVLVLAILYRFVLFGG